MPPIGEAEGRLGQAMACSGPVGAQAGKVSDLTEEPIRAWPWPTAMMDVKACSVSEEWSGLKLVWRKENRK